MVPESLPTWFARTVATHANLPALRVKRNHVWKTWTYQQYFDDVRAVAKAFIYLGLEPYQAVGIIGFNSPEWFISDLAAIYAGYVYSSFSLSDLFEKKKRSCKKSLSLVNDQNEVEIFVRNVCFKQ